MNNELSNGMLINLLDLCRNELQITWEDEETDKRIKMHIKNGFNLIADKGGVKENDFVEGGKANALLLAYVRRAISGDTSTFLKDYLDGIISLQVDFDIESSVENE